MTRLIARRLQVPPEPLSLARALQRSGLPHVALLHGASAGRSWLAAAPDQTSDALDPFGNAARLDDPLASMPRWIGVIPYEALRAAERPAWRRPDQRAAPLIERPRWLRYPAALRIDHEVVAMGVDERSVERLVKAIARQPCAGTEAMLEVGCDEPDQQHVQRVTRARELIVEGHLYQVSLARRLSVELKRGDALDTYARLVAKSPSPLCAFIDLDGDRSVLSTTPELLLRAEPGADGGFGRLSTAPIKGTRPRGGDAEHDAALAAELDADPKERAELAMIIDVERNDLGRVCQVGSVQIARAPYVSTSRTVHHRRALLVGHARAGVTRQQVLEAMLPSGSVTGAPKIRAMEVIAELERHRRGLYTGAIGYVSHDGGIQLAMAIRTLVLAGGRGHYWTGGGIVADSVPELELQETSWKALQLGDDPLEPHIGLQRA